MLPTLREPRIYRVWNRCIQIVLTRPGPLRACALAYPEMAPQDSAQDPQALEAREEGRQGSEPLRESREARAEREREAAKLRARLHLGGGYRGEGMVQALSCGTWEVPRYVLRL